MSAGESAAKELSRAFDELRQQHEQLRIRLAEHPTNTWRGPLAVAVTAMMDAVYGPPGTPKPVDNVGGRRITEGGL